LAALFLATAALAAPAPRIVNGVGTTGHPAVGALLAPADPQRASLVCSGTLIGCRTFLTAAHCVEGDLDPASYLVFFQHAGFFAVSAVAAHPSYSFPVADVAVLTLAAPVSGIQPMPIDVAGGQIAGSLGTIVGFGRSGGSAQDYGIKREGAVALGPCSGGISDGTSICWSFTSPVGPAGDDSNTCNGDSGGPLFTDVGTGIVTAGITSGGTSATCLADDDSYDARVAAYASYIQATGAGDVGATSCSALPQVGSPDVAVSGFAGTLASSASIGTHTFTVPSGAATLRVTMNAVDDGSDFDLYVRAGTPPTTTTFDCAANGAGQFGACEFTNPAPGPWYVLVSRFGGGGPYQVTATSFTPFCSTPGNAGLPCDDGDACTTGEQCSGGVCTGGGAVTCDDGIPCTVDACHPTLGCVATPDHAACGPCAACDPDADCVAGPRPDCTAPTAPEASLLRLQEGSDPTSDLIVWKWTRGAATTAGDFGSPATSTDYRLCIFDESGPGSTLTLRADLPAGGVCDGGTCWQTAGTTLKYRDDERTPDGITKLVAKPGGDGQSKATLKGKGVNLPPLPILPLALPTRVQLQADGAGCFEAVFDADGIVRSDAGSFIGRGE
jgi:hypothetical protein